MAIRPDKHFARFLNNPDYIFGMVDITNDEKVLKTTRLACQNLVNIQCQEKILGGEEKHKDSLVDLAMTIIKPYYRGMKDVCKKKKVASHCTCVRRLDEDHVKCATKEAYVSSEMCRKIVDMRK
ncbi:hypothetical protein D1007_00032 [Hordeum vulgare]|nr:hypothetical protein D1007_00032 [Hordeum vulgare]